MRKWWTAAALTGWLGCASDDPSLPPVGDGADGDTSTGETDGGEPDPCAVSGGGDGGDGDGDGPVKFDVGAEGFEFPKTCAEVADTQTNIGCEFWAVDLPNDWQGGIMSPPAADQQFAVVVANASSLEPANVSIYLGDTLDPLDAAVVEVDGTHQFDLNPQSIDPQQSTSDGVAFRIESDIPITAYQFNPLDNQVPVYSNDASLLFPTPVLGLDYAAVTGDGILLSSGVEGIDPEPAGAFVSVVATEDDTMVDVFPTGDLLPGPTEGVLLGRGQVLTVLSDAQSPDSNLSGTRVVADRPVAVFSGNVASVEPIDTATCCADHLEHQMLPFEAWSTSYAIAPPPAALGGNDLAVYRITAALDDTELVWCPLRPEGAPVVADSLRTYTFESSKPFTVRSKDPEQPISITQFLESNRTVDDTGKPGDPAMIAIPAAAQFQYKYVFAVPPGYAYDFVTIVARGAGKIELDGVAIPDDELSDLAVINGVMHRYVHRELEAGPHRVEAEVAIGITVIGYDEAVSFGFPGGVGLRVIASSPPQG